MLKVNIHRAIGDFSGPDWDQTIGVKSIFYTKNWHDALERGGLNDCPATHLVFRDSADEIIAHTVAYSIKTSLVLFSNGLVKSVVAGIRKWRPDFLRVRVIECGLPVGLGLPVAMRPGYSLQDVTDKLFAVLEQIAKSQCARFIVVRDFSGDELARIDAEQPNFHPIQNLPGCMLPIHWASFDEYVDAMQARHRYKIKRKLQTAMKSGLRVEICDALHCDAVELCRQVSNQNKEAREYDRDIVTVEFYRNIALLFEERCKIIKIVQKGRMIAHALVLFDGLTLRWLTFGRDTPGERDGAHFLVLREVVKLGIESGMQVVDMGPTTYRSKMDFGATVIPLWFLLRIRANTLIARIAVAILRKTNPVYQGKNRSAFKLGTSG